MEIDKKTKKVMRKVMRNEPLNPDEERIAEDYAADLYETVKSTQSLIDRMKEKYKK